MVGTVRPGRGSLTGSFARWDNDGAAVVRGRQGQHRGGVMARTATSNLQAPPLTDDELHEFLQTAELARIATHNEDGSIHVAPLWFRYRAPEIDRKSVV